MNSPISTEILRIEGLVFAYPGEMPLWSGWSVAIGPGVTSIVGDTASGKTTLLRLIGGDLAPQRGRFVIGGVDRKFDAPAYQKRVCWVEPSTNAYDAMKARECAATLFAGGEPLDADLWQAMVDGFSLEAQLDKPVYMLSTGSRRKLWLAAALASRRPLVLLDEPAGALDAASRRCLWQVLDTLDASRDRAVIVASGERIDSFVPSATLVLPV